MVKLYKLKIECVRLALSNGCTWVGAFGHIHLMTEHLFLKCCV